MEYRPAGKSLFASLIWALSPVILAGGVTYFMYESAHWLLWVLDVFMVLFSLIFLIQALYVHTLRLYVDDHQIRTSNFLRTTQIYWPEVTKAVLRERENAMSRTDHLLILEGPYQLLSFNTSTLTPADEAEVLTKVREKTRLIVQYDRPSI